MLIATIGFVGTVLGILGTLLAAFLNNKQQIRKVRLENEHNFRLEKLKIATSIKKDKLCDLLPKLEEAAGLVSKLSLEYSLTASYINRLKKISPEQYNEWYLKSGSDLDRLTAIIKINFDELSDQLNELVASTNIFWGNQQNLLQHNIDGDKSGSKVLLDKVVETGQIIKNISMSLLNDMSIIAKQLNDSLLG